MVVLPDDRRAQAFGSPGPLRRRDQARHRQTGRCAAERQRPHPLRPGRHLRRQPPAGRTSREHHPRRTRDDPGTEVHAPAGLRCRRETLGRRSEDEGPRRGVEGARSRLEDAGRSRQGGAAAAHAGDVEGSDDMLTEIPGSIQNSSITHTETWTTNMKKGADYYRKQHGVSAVENPDTSLEVVLSRLKSIYKAYKK